MTDVSRRSAHGAKADRDRILEQALTHELRGDVSPTPQCLDAETLAAWQDDALDATQMAAIELHVSTCARCQAMVAAFARGTVGTADAPGTAGAPATPGNFSWWRWWLAPIAAATAAVTLWMVVPDEQQRATAPPSRPTAAVAVDSVQPRANAEGKSPTPPAAPAETRERAADLDADRAKLKADASRDDRQELKDQAPAAAKEEVAAAAPPPAAPAAAMAQRAEAVGAAPAELQKSARLAFAGTEIVAPDFSTRWRAVEAGIERSTDAGATWTLVHQARNVSITAGMAPSSTVCWLASASGVVYVSGDGATFVQTNLPPPPPDYAWSMRIVSIVATDARNATVGTADGTRFSTNDGGRTWRLIPA